MKEPLRKRRLPLWRKSLTKPIVIHDEAAYEGMARAGHVVASILDDLCDEVQPGISTRDLDRLVEERIAHYGVRSATIGYRGYRHASCISVNHVICHGVPGNRKLREGDILNIDVTIVCDGWFGDSSRMYAAGSPTIKARRLIRVAHEALFAGLAKVRPGNTFGDIGHAIERHAAAHRMSSVKSFCGHGIGRQFHLPPEVAHFGRPGTGPVLRQGMMFTVEPMINLGRPEARVLEDGWTAVTRDRKLSAQFEHTVGVTQDGCRIFTLSPAGRFYPTNFRAGRQ
ncbi:MAG: type I methionyl aminopeptidase [Rhodobacteraceae bacterium]|nr:type I methionyl aminopeptidase [Paracoccaceae bacterium]